MKKALPWIAVALCVLLLAAIVFGVLHFAKLVNKSAEQSARETVTVENYFAENWDSFRFVLYEEETGCVILQKALDITYEQACSFGKECYEELALGHKDSFALMLAGCKSSCDVTLKDICINGVSSDGEVVYSIRASGAMTACWD